MSSIQGILRNVKGAHNEFILLNTAYNKRHNAVKNISSNVNLLMLSEIKIDDSFPKSLVIHLDLIETLLTEGFCFMLGKIFRQNLYLLKLYQQKVFFVEINLHKKLLVSCSYNPHRDNISNQLQMISKSLDLYLSQYGNIVIAGNFNVEIGGKLYECFL